MKSIEGHIDCQCLIFCNITSGPILNEVINFFKEKSLIPYFANTRFLNLTVLDRYKCEYKKLFASKKYEDCHLLYPLLMITELTEQEFKTLNNNVKFSLMKILLDVLKKQDELKYKDQTLEESRSVSINTVNTLLGSFNKWKNAILLFMLLLYKNVLWEPEQSVNVSNPSNKS
jgi:hypothetical protein